MMSAKSCVAVVMMTAIGLSGCASLPKMDTFRPVSIDTSFGTPRYLQDGHAIDAGDMNDKLAEEPEASSYVTGARVLRVVSVLLAATGGALVGYPVGQELAGKTKPAWTLAGVGAACIGVSIPVTIGAVVSQDSAVKAHNRSLDGKSARVERPAPAATFGLAFDQSLAAARAGALGVTGARPGPLAASADVSNKAVAERKP